ncbi:MAG: carboxymethylenebutenolidase [Chloroflexota bacterium]|jgi:carboxymethylenebutenolidase|nr:carboxymethylenebutenolidase [Chloroflexota bacterium]
MCFDHDSEPPIPRMAGAAVDGGTIELTAADGNRFSAFLAASEEPTGAGMIVLPDVRGLHHYYEELALRFAEAGIDAIAIDYFGRTAGIGSRGEDFDFQPHVAQLTWEGLRADAMAAAERLRSERDVKALFSVGFCMGGRLSFALGTVPELGLAGAIGFYGWPAGEHRSGSPSPTDHAAEMGGAVLGIFGGADQGIGPEVVAAFDAALEAAGVDHRVVTYPNAPHSFFDRKQAEFADASAAAWGEVLEFVNAHTPGK